MRFSLPNLANQFCPLPPILPTNPKEGGLFLSSFIEEILSVEFDELRCYLRAHKYDDFCMPYFRCFVRELVRKDYKAADESRKALQKCVPDSEFVFHWWIAMEAAALLVQGAWLREEEQTFEMGVLLAEIGRASLAKRAHLACHSHPLFPIFPRLVKGGAL